MKTRLVIALILIQFFSTPKAQACTTFVLKEKGQIVYGRNFDFEVGNGFIINNHRGIKKHAFVGNETNLMTWISKFGSITFNQFGQEFPYGGMNEKGLVVAQMFLSKTKYPEIDDRKAISVLQWIQFQLDVASSVEEVIASDSILRISNEVPIGLHFLVCDAKGNSASIEFLDGKMVCHKDEELPVPLLTNNMYDESISYLQQFDIMGGSETIPWKKFSDIEWTNDNILGVNQVFATAANTMLKKQNESTLIDRAFDVLQSVTIENHTKWSIVFDVTNHKIYFKNGERKEVIALELKDFDFVPNQNTKILDIQTATSDNVMNQFIDFTPELNREYVLKAYAPLMKNGFIPVRLPDEVIEAHARFPETLKKMNSN